MCVVDIGVLRPWDPCGLSLCWGIAHDQCVTVREKTEKGKTTWFRVSRRKRHRRRVCYILFSALVS